MDESDLRLLLLVAVLLIAALAVAYLRLRLRLHQLVHEQLSAWKKTELESARSQLWRVAQSEAGTSLERWRLETEAEIRADAVRRSSAVVTGKVSEHLAPYMRAFPYNPKDARFLGTPVDLIVFDGMSDDALREIVFLEIKSRGASLTTRERRVRDAVLARQVSWREFRVDGEGD
jgi:predicted Holliday junction resolvase-like endonuclease